MRVLVTGSEGFIGSHVVENLLSNGIKVRALVQYNSVGSNGWLESTKNDPGLEIILGDVRDPYQMDRLCDGVDAIAHLAALIAIPYSYEAPDSYVQTNVIGTLNLLNAARNNRVERFIQTSTSEVYGTARYVPIDELHPLQPQSPYSASKIAADALAQSFFNSFDLPVTTIRPFNTFGPRQSLRAVIPTLALQFLRKVPILKVGALSPTRDFTFVTDTANAFRLALQAKGVEGEVINLGTGFELSISDIIEDLKSLTGHVPEIHIDDERLRPGKSEVERLLSANDKALSLLGWEPSISGREGFREGLNRTLNWLESQSQGLNIDPGNYVR
jgi:NAD dependent epimerase/dehydratase